MGFYSPSNQASQYTLYGAGIGGEIAVTTAAADKTLGTIVLPAALIGTVKAAYLDVEFLYLNTSGANNYTETLQYIEASDGATPINAVVLASGEIRTPNDTMVRRVKLRGTVDISSIAVGGATITVIWRGADMHANGITLTIIQNSIRFITG